ncbi:MAG: DUF3429 domain-containing protein [Gammaproteobacteria bacterium]|nr:DUF3429 domain-containing protein [Gammaproteobacteria bacterium]
MAAKNSKIPKVPLTLGLLGLLPFLASSLISLFSIDPYQHYAAQSLAVYGAVILSFLGGASWGARLNVKARVGDWAGMTWAIVPSLIAWISLLLPPVMCLAVLVAGFALQYFLDVDSVNSKVFPRWYARLRVILTAGVIVTLLIALVGRVVYQVTA